MTETAHSERASCGCLIERCGGCDRELVRPDGACDCDQPIPAGAVIRTTADSQIAGDRYVVLAAAEWEMPFPSATGAWFQAVQLGGYFSGQRMWFNAADHPRYFVVEARDAA